MFLSRDRIPVNDVRVFHGLHACIQPENDSFLFQYLPDTVRNVPVLPGYQFGRALEHRDLRTERSIHGSKFQSDVSPAYNDELCRQLSQFHNGGAGIYPWVTLYPLYRWNDGFGTRIDEYPGSLQL